MERINWGIMGLGRIAGIFAQGLLQARHGRLAAVASRTAAKAEAFGADFLPVPNEVKRYGSYEALLADPGIQAVYIAVPHPQHAQWALRAIEARKAVLCEKPLGINHAEAMVLVNAAREANVFLMEAFMYRCHPIIAKILEIVRSGVLGEVRAMQANFAFNAGTNLTSRLLANEAAGGGILDVGCYPVSLARLVAGAVSGQSAPLEPTVVKAVGQMAATGVDAYTFATLQFGNGFLAAVGTGVQCGMDNTIRIYGTNGSVELGRWVMADTGNTLTLRVAGKEAEIIAVDADRNVYALEADALAEAVAAGRTQGAYPAMTWEDTLGNMRALDAWRGQIGLTYEAEKPERQTAPVGGRALAVRADAAMPYGRVAGLDKPVSRLVFGTTCVSINAMPNAAALFDDFFARGGNAFDTAHIYGGGTCERALGQWVKNRQVREKVVILGKGAHTPNCNPKALTAQLRESLDRMQLDYVDIYMMHRDNPEIPVGEFVEALNEQRRAGRMRAFGGSNWTLERIEAFQAYAQQHKLQGFSAVSNQFSLARMVAAPWDGCLSASGPEGRAWHERTKLPLMPWSSQAQGFFVNGDPADTSDANLVRCWYAADNFQRLARAKELAAKKRCTAIQIALAYVLAQLFPTFPLIGPRTIEETRTSLLALGVKLTADEGRWLNLGD